MYEEISDENPYKTPMMIYPAIHYTMGGIWVDYELMTSIQGLFAIGEANFSDHGANRLGASALMQGLADGYFVLPYTIQNYLADQIQIPRFSTDLPEFAEAERTIKDKINRIKAVNGKQSVDSIHKKIRSYHVELRRHGSYQRILTESFERNSRSKKKSFGAMYVFRVKQMN